MESQGILKGKLNNLCAIATNGTCFTLTQRHLRTIKKRRNIGVKEGVFERCAASGKH